MDLVDKLEKLMQENKIKNILSLSNNADIPYTTLKSIFNREVTDIRLSTAVKLSKFFNVSLDYLLDDNNQDPSTSLDEESSAKSVFPLLGTVKAGYDYLTNQNIIGHISIDRRIPDLESCYALKVTGDSMQPVLYEDDIVIVHKQEDIENGQIGIVLIDNDEATVKKIVKYDDHIELVALNPYYPIKKLTDKDNFKIIGKVIEARITKIFE